jgi:hypothetical protein
VVVLPSSSVSVLVFSIRSFSVMGPDNDSYFLKLFVDQDVRWARRQLSLMKLESSYNLR